MQMPRNKVTSVTEKIMAWVRAKTDQHPTTKIETSAHSTTASTKASTKPWLPSSRNGRRAEMTLSMKEVR